MISDELLKIAFTQYGVKEIVGAKENPEVLKYFSQLGIDPSLIKESTAWCSAFMNWIVSKSSRPSERSMRLNARSWLSIGYEVKDPQPGDLVIFWRESPTSWKGHVGLYVNRNNKLIYCLGGNQDNMVNIKAYDDSRLLQFRRI